MRIVFVVLSGLILCLSFHGCAAPPASPAESPVVAEPAVVAPKPPTITDPKDQVVLQKFLGHARTLALATTKEHCQSIDTPETFCWVDLRNLDLSVTAYELTGDSASLADFVTGFENLRSCLVPGPDGLLGWRGKPIPFLRDPAKPDVVIDEIQTDFRAVAVLSHFVEVIDRDPVLRRRYAFLRAQYLDLMENQLVKKWDARDYYVDLGDRGAIYRWNVDYTPLKVNLTLAHEKQALMVEALLNLYRVTGRAEYMAKAVQLGTWFKKCLVLTDGHYAWNYWNPAGPWDVNPTDPTKWKHWLGREPQGNWHAVTVGSALILYQHGLVFDRTDVDRFLRTQMEVCWNGDLAHPVFNNTDGKPLPKERMIAPSLAPFNTKLAELVYGPAAQDERIAKADSSWFGGMIAGEYLQGKYLYLPQALGGRQIYAVYAEKFLAVPENRALVEKLKFEVVAPGCQTSFAPPQTTDLTK